ncbi:trans-sialidase, putative, partial [Trypanosoma cruzi]
MSLSLSVRVCWLPPCCCGAALFCVQLFSMLFLPDCLVSCTLRGCSALLPSNVSDVLPLLLPSPLLEQRHARKESNQTRIATVKFEGSERTKNSTHTAHTHICMLSRVAAVMAPRTHNRRRVTGSSGRMREGGESERQRPNMSRRVFTSAVMLLLVVLMCCGSGAAAVEQAGAAVDPFKGTKPISFANWREFKDGGSKITSLRVPGLVEVGDDVFAVAEAQCGEKDGAGICAGIVSKHLDIKGDPMDISTPDISLFCMQLVDTAENNFGTTEVLRPTTLVIENSVYMLVGNQSRTTPPVEGTNE